MTDAELCLAAGTAAEVWKSAHEMYPTMTLDPTFSGIEIRGDQCYLVPNNPFRQDPRRYDPLRDDEQAMALLKKFGMRVDYDKAALNDKPQWYAQTFDYERNKWNKPAEAENLNRAVVMCAAGVSTD